MDTTTSLKIFYEELLLLEEDRDEMLNYIIEKGDKLKPMALEEKTTNNLIAGCASQVWLGHKKINSTIVFFVDSDSKIIRGILFFLLETISGKSLEAIIEEEFHIIAYIKNRKIISQKRLNGMDSIILKIKNIAAGYFFNSIS